MLPPFEQIIYDRFSQSIASWDTERRSDVYALLFYIDTSWSADADGQEVIEQCVIHLTYNTLSFCDKQTARGCRLEEAKWDLSYWPYDYTAHVPAQFEYGTDPPVEDFALRDAWCAAQGIIPDGKDGGGRPKYEERALAEAIYGACIRVAQAMHTNGVIETAFGRPVPIIIAEHDHEHECADITRAANPPGLAREAEEALMR
jgi:hypothetical protein